MKIRVLHILPAVLVSVLLVTSVLYAWTEPSVAPPGGNVLAPLNVGTIGQSKLAGLALNSGNNSRYGLLIQYGNVGIGTLSPGQKLDVQGGSIRSDTGFCIGASCITSWPSSGTGTVTSVATNNGLTGGTITTSGTLGLNLTGISSCTNSTSNKIYWNGSYLACGVDQTGAGGGLTGSGSTNYISKWTGATSLGNSQIYDNGTNVGIGTASPTSKLTIGSGTNYETIEVKKGAVYIRDSGYSNSTLQLLARDIRTSNNEDLYLNWDNASGNVVIGGDTEKKVLYLAGPSGGAGVGSAVDAPDYWIRSVNRWASAPPAISGEFVCNQPKSVNWSAGTSSSCTMGGTWDICFLTKVAANDPTDNNSDVNRFSCTITGSGSAWRIDTHVYGNDINCTARCINW